MASLSVHLTCKEVWCTFILNGSVLTVTGVFATEEHAVKECSQYEGVACLPVGERFPAFINELPKAYAPHSGVRWEESPMFYIQQRAKQVVREFFLRPVE